MLVEEALDEKRSEDEVAATSEGRVEAGDEEVKVGSENAGAFYQHCPPSTTHHRDGQHGSGQVDDRDVDDEESHLGAAFILGICPDKGHDQGCFRASATTLRRRLHNVRGLPSRNTEYFKYMPAVSFRKVSMLNKDRVGYQRKQGWDVESG